MRFIVAAAAGLCVGGSAYAQFDPIAVWTFETSIPVTSGPHAAESGANAGAGSTASGFHTDPGTVWSNPAGNGSPESFSSNFWTIGDYYEFRTSTAGFTSIRFGWDQTRSSTGPATFDVAWSTDGVAFSTLVEDYAVTNNATPPGVWNSTTPVPEYTFAPVDLPAGAASQTTLYIRLVNQVAPGGTAGTNRVDNVRIEGLAIDCYPDCNQSGTLTIADFGCFQAAFAAGNMYADCNASGTLTIADFGCFQAAFAAGCP